MRLGLVILTGVLSACGQNSAKQSAPPEPVAASAEEQAFSLPRAEIVEFCREAQLRHPADANAQLLMINQFAAGTSEPRRVAELCTTYAQGAADAAQELAQDIERQRAKAK